MKNVITFGKQIWTDYAGDRFLLVSGNDYTGTGISGHATRPVEDCSITVLNGIEDSDWSDPMLQEMQRECLLVMSGKLHHASELSATLETMLAKFPAPAALPIAS